MDVHLCRWVYTHDTRRPACPEKYPRLDRQIFLLPSRRQTHPLPIRFRSMSVMRKVMRNRYWLNYKDLCQKISRKTPNLGIAQKRDFQRVPSSFPRPTHCQPRSIPPASSHRIES